MKNPMKKLVFMLAAVLATLLGATAVYGTTSRTMVVESISGTVNMTRGTTRSFAAREGTRLAAGNTLSTGTNASAAVLLDNASTVMLNASTTVDITRAGNVLELSVVTGSLAVHAAPQETGRSINVRAGNATMGVRGTLFTVVLDGEAVQVHLLEGELEGSTPYATLTLYAGQSLMICEYGTAEAQPLQLRALDQFTLETIRDNAAMLMEVGTVSRGDLFHVERRITVLETEAAAQEEARQLAISEILYGIAAEALAAEAAALAATEAAEAEATSEYEATPATEATLSGSAPTPPGSTPAAAPPAAEAGEATYEYTYEVDEQGRTRRRRWRRFSR